MTPHFLILLGASTGGPGRIHTLLSSLEPQFDGTIIIAQHMAAPFITSFANQLQSICPLPVIEIDRSEKIENGCIYICKITSHLINRNKDLWIEPVPGNDFAFNPEINPLFISASQLESKIMRMGVILTGIGEDGAVGALSLHRSGGICYFENEQSATVFGMPRRAKELVQEGRLASMDEIIAAIKNFGDKDVRMV